MTSKEMLTVSELTPALSESVTLIVFVVESMLMSPDVNVTAPSFTLAL
ncbi:hypothetical protein [Halobellus rubicundus]|uniref:Uncharacterized protein n=1 Tax=Halobellus rubicundus TaxID=2996466 RepID=A0ABD5MEF0_9EURY